MLPKENESNKNTENVHTEEDHTAVDHKCEEFIKVLFGDALVILVSSWNIFYTLDSALPEKSFPHKKNVD